MNDEGLADADVANPFRLPRVHPPVKAEPDGAPLEAAGSSEVLVDNPRWVAQSFATPTFHRSRCAFLTQEVEHEHREAR